MVPVDFHPHPVFTAGDLVLIEYLLLFICLFSIGFFLGHNKIKQGVLVAKERIVYLYADSRKHWICWKRVGCGQLGDLLYTLVPTLHQFLARFVQLPVI